MEFMREFPDDEACLDWLWRSRYASDGHTADCPKCGQPRRFHRVKDRPAYDCDTCGHHLHPTAGTIFHKSSTSLHLWFHAMFLISQTRCGISAKHLERELGVTYKTAWRMFNLIRNQLMEQDNEPCRARSRPMRPMSAEQDAALHAGDLRPTHTRRRSSAWSSAGGRSQPS